MLSSTLLSCFVASMKRRLSICSLAVIIPRCVKQSNMKTCDWMADIITALRAGAAGGCAGAESDSAGAAGAVVVSMVEPI